MYTFEKCLQRILINKEIEYFEEESEIDLITLNYDKRLQRRNSRTEEIENRRNQNLSELGYTDDYDFDEFRDETILNEVYSVMIDMITEKEQSVSILTSPSLQDNS